MLNPLQIEEYLDLAIHATYHAMREITLVYNSHFQVEYKADYSPVTLADKKADQSIRQTLEKSGIYIMSEEEVILPYSERLSFDKIWIVDPLDGTKEFIKRNGEFTTNIALAEDGIPILGVIGIPVSGEVYFGAKGIGSFKAKTFSGFSRTAALIQQSTPLPFAVSPQRPVRIMGSRSHTNHSTENFIRSVRNKFPTAEVLPGGSSLKLCRIAEGSIDLYPRFSPINEWDVAAGDALIRYSGGRIFDPETGNDLQYNKEDLLQFPFVAVRKGFELEH